LAGKSGVVPASLSRILRYRGVNRIQALEPFASRE
jgi:hypothetical protein